MSPHADPTTAAPVSVEAPLHQQKDEAPQTNGTTPSSKTLSHLASFPIVSDSVHVVTSHPLGQRGLSLSTRAYSTLITPLSPYLSPYVHHATPYVSKADAFADSNLSKLESRLPILREPTESIKDTLLSPPRKLKEHVWKVYDDEWQKIDGGAGVLPKAKAGVTSVFVLGSEAMGVLATYLGRAKETAAQGKSAPAAPTEQVAQSA